MIAGPQNKGMKLTNLEPIGGSQLIPSVRRLVGVFTKANGQHGVSAA